MALDGIQMAGNGWDDDDIDFVIKDIPSALIPKEEAEGEKINENDFCKPAESSQSLSQFGQEHSGWDDDLDELTHVDVSSIKKENIDTVLGIKTHQIEDIPDLKSRLIEEPSQYKFEEGWDNDMDLGHLVDSHSFENQPNLSDEVGDFNTVLGINPIAEPRFSMDTRTEDHPRVNIDAIGKIKISLDPLKTTQHIDDGWDDEMLNIDPLAPHPSLDNVFTSTAPCADVESRSANGQPEPANSTILSHYDEYDEQGELLSMVEGVESIEFALDREETASGLEQTESSNDDHIADALEEHDHIESGVTDEFSTGFTSDKHDIDSGSTQDSVGAVDERLDEPQVDEQSDISRIVDNLPSEDLQTHLLESEHNDHNPETILNEDHTVESRNMNADPINEERQLDDHGTNYTVDELEGAEEAFSGKESFSGLSTQDSLALSFGGLKVSTSHDNRTVDHSEYNVEDEIVERHVNFMLDEESTAELSGDVSHKRNYIETDVLHEVIEKEALKDNNDSRIDQELGSNVTTESIVNKVEDPNGWSDESLELVDEPIGVATINPSKSEEELYSISQEHLRLVSSTNEDLQSHQETTFDQTKTLDDGMEFPSHSIYDGLDESRYIEEGWDVNDIVLDDTPSEYIVGPEDFGEYNAAPTVSSSDTHGELPPSEQMASPTPWFSGVLKNIGAKTVAGIDKIYEAIDKPQPIKFDHDDEFKSVLDKLSHGEVNLRINWSSADEPPSVDDKFRSLFDTIKKPDDTTSMVGKIGQTTMNIAHQTKNKITPAVTGLASKVKKKIIDLPIQKIRLSELDLDIKALLFSDQSVLSALEMIQITACKFSTALKKQNYRPTGLSQFSEELSSASVYFQLDSPGPWSEIVMASF